MAQYSPKIGELSIGSKKIEVKGNGPGRGVLWAGRLRGRPLVIGTPCTTESVGRPSGHSSPRPPFLNRAISLALDCVASSPEMSPASHSMEALDRNPVPPSISTCRVRGPKKFLKKFRTAAKIEEDLLPLGTFHGDGRVRRDVVSAASNKQLAECKGPWYPLTNAEQAGPIPSQIEFRRGSIPGREPRSSAALGGRA